MIQTGFIAGKYKKDLATSYCNKIFSQRFLADSNRRKRFCRPLTKPLIQGTDNILIYTKDSHPKLEVPGGFEPP